MADSFQYDVFISHSSNDKGVVRDLAQRLKKDGLRVWPRDMAGPNVEKGGWSSRACWPGDVGECLCSESVTLERRTVMFRDPTNAQRRFVPLRLDDAAIKDTLRQFCLCRLAGTAVEEYGNLLAACRPVVGEAARGMSGHAFLTGPVYFPTGVTISGL